MAVKTRTVAWDVQRDWLKHGFTPAETLAELAQLLAAHSTTPARITFAGRARDAALFERFCRAAYLWGHLAPCCVIVEELSWVTSPGKAPPGWLELVTGGLKYGIDLVSTTQRPADSDKTALSEATIKRCFQVDRPKDRKYLAEELGVDVARIAALRSPEGGPFQFVERDTRRDRVTETAITL